MKKLSCSMMKALLISFTVFMLAGCGKKEPTPGDVVGTWTCYDNSIHGNDVIYVINSIRSVLFGEIPTVQSLHARGRLKSRKTA